MTEAQLLDLPIPKLLGRPLYPAGFPLRKEQMSFEDRTIEQIWREYLDCTVNRKEKPNKDDVDFLKYYIIYYFHAPIWHTKELCDKVNLKMTLSELIHTGMDYGLDPL